MQTKNRSRTKLTTIAAFPRHYFLENVVIRGDNSMLVTVMNKQERMDCQRFKLPSRDRR